MEAEGSDGEEGLVIVEAGEVSILDPDVPNKDTNITPQFLTTSTLPRKSNS